MDSDNNNIVTLPTYIIKQILKLICGFINYNNKLIETIGQVPNQKSDYRENETEVKKLMIIIALVSKGFFQTLSNNLYVSVDFNYRRPSLLYGTENSKKYSIVKLENVRTLKIHYEHDPNKEYFYRMLSTKVELPIEQSYIDREMEILVNGNNLKKLKLRNIKNTNVNLSKLLSFFSKFKDQLAISLLEVEINESTTQQQLLDTHNIAKKTFSLIISCGDKEIILQSFKLWSEKLYQLYITSPPSLNFNLFKTLAGKDGSQTNYLKNLAFIEIYGFETRLKDLQYILSNGTVPRLNTFSVNVCFDKLIYLLSTPDERKTQTRRCLCNSLVFAKTSEDEHQSKEIKKFEKYWAMLLQLFKTNSTIKQITFGHECRISGGIFKTKKLYTGTFYQKFAELITSVVNLKKFIILGINAPKLFQEIIKVNQNKSIIHFEAGVVLHDDYKEFVTSLESLVVKYNHIQSLKFTEYIFKINKYEQSILFDFKR